MRIRTPSWAGLFYPAAADACRRELEACLPVSPVAIDGPAGLVGGVVPHAGWGYSGKVAGMVFDALARASTPDCILLFGAWHRPRGSRAVLCGADRWRTPLGDLIVDADFSDAVRSDAEWFETDLQASDTEHSLEVQGPFLARCLTDVPIFPVLVPPAETAVQIGRRLAEHAMQLNKRVLCIASTDLTHYGPRYQFTPMGRGPQGIQWATDTNDRQMIDLIVQFKVDEVVPESRAHRNACGPGAVAASLAALSLLGASSASVLCHTNSAETTGDRDANDAVGYAGIVFQSKGAQA